LLGMIKAIPDEKQMQGRKERANTMRVISNYLQIALRILWRHKLMMNTIRFSILASLLSISLLALAVAVSAEAPVEYQVHFTAEDMAIDGRANEKSWSLAPLIKMVDRAYPSGKTLSPSITTVQALWSEQGLLVLFLCKDEDILATFTERDNRGFYKDDDVELFLDPDMDGTSYVQLAINALNTKMDVLRREPQWTDGGMPAFYDWDSGTESAVVVSGSLEDRTDRDESWTVELLFPWSSMSQATLNVLVSEGYGIDVLGGRSIPPKMGDKWKANLIRFDHGDKEGAGVLSTWSPFPDGDGAFISNNCVHYSTYWGVLVFVE
ncbi:MAG: hypothetical protein F4Z57_14160, partial [Gemmatimonadetes bacterium]|nr:hypothetical protein [Gemmatimonadota bacterium]